MQHAGVEVGGEEHAVLEGIAQRLQHHQLVGHIVADDADRLHLGLGVTPVALAQPLVDQAAQIVALIAALGPLDRRRVTAAAARIVTRLGIVVGAQIVVAAPVLRRRALDRDAVEAAQVLVGNQVDLEPPFRALAGQPGAQRLGKGAGVDRVPFANQGDAPARAGSVRIEAAREQLGHQPIDQQVVGADGAHEELRPRGGQLWPGPGRVVEGLLDLVELLLEGLFDRLDAARTRRLLAVGRMGRRQQLLIGCRRVGADQADLGQGLPAFAEGLGRVFALRRLGLLGAPLAGFLEQIREIDAERIDQPAGIGGTQDAEPHALAGKVKVLEQDGDPAEPVPAEQAVVDPQDHHAPLRRAGVAWAVRRSAECLIDHVNHGRRRGGGVARCRRCIVGGRRHEVGRLLVLALVLALLAFARAAAERLAARQAQQAHPFAVVGDVARDVQAGEHGVAVAPPRFRAADEGAAGQHRGDDGQAVMRVLLRKRGRSFRRAVLTARLGAGEGRAGGCGGRRAGTNILQLREVATQGLQRIFPEPRFDRRLGRPDLPAGIVLDLAQQIEAARRQEGGRQEQCHDGQPGNGKGRSAIARHWSPPTMATIPRFKPGQPRSSSGFSKSYNRSWNLPQRARRMGEGYAIQLPVAGHLCGESHKPGACLETPPTCCRSGRPRVRPGCRRSRTSGAGRRGTGASSSGSS